MRTLITNNWNSYLNLIENEKKDIYYFEEYVKLYESTDGKALCAICGEKENVTYKL